MEDPENRTDHPDKIALAAYLLQATSGEPYPLAANPLGSAKRAMDDDPRSSSLSELRELGLTVDISEREAIKIKADLLIIDGRLRRGHYPESRSAYSRHLSAAYDAIARGVIQANTSDNVLEDMIPEMVERFRLKQQWYPVMTYDMLKQILGGAITEWKGRRLLIKPDVRANHPSEIQATHASRAVWLRKCLLERSWNNHDPARHGGPDRKTIEKILRGQNVREEVLERLANALSKKRGKVDVTEIPTD